MAETLNQRIKNLRKEKGLTQLELADKLNITDKAVSKWEASDGNPDILLLPKLASILGVSIDYLLTGEQQETISLEDMDVSKRLSYIVKKDDLDLFEKYDYCKDEFIFEKYFRNDKSSKLNEVLFKEIFKYKAHNIFKFIMKYVLNKCKLFNAYYAYNFIDDFVIECIDTDSHTILSTMKLNRFDLSDTKQPYPVETFRNRYNNYEYFNRLNLHLFIKPETFEYFFKKKKDAPNCYKYITSIKLKDYDDYYRQETDIITYLTDYILYYSLKYKYYETIDEILELFLLQGKKSCRESYFGKTLTKGYIFGGQEYYIEGRYLFINEEIINAAIVSNDDYADKFIEYNKTMKEILICNSSNNKPYFDKVYIPNEKTKKDVLISFNDELSDIDKIKALLDNSNVVDMSLLDELLENSFTQDSLDYCKKVLATKPVTNFELIKGYYLNKEWSSLFKFLVDYDFDDYLLSFALNNKFEQLYENLKGPLWDYYKTNYSGYKPHVFDINNKYIDYSYRPKRVASGSEEWENDILKYIKDTKENWINKKQYDLDKFNLNIKMDSISSTISRKYIDEQLKKGNVEIVIIKLCAKLEALLSKRFNREDDLVNLLNEYCEKNLHWVQDDGWGYDEYCSDDTQIDLLNKLRANRNNIAHPQQTGVENLNADELNKCIDYVFKLEEK